RGTAVPILLLLLLLLLGTARAQPSCLRFPELLPAKLKELRLKFEEIKDYFVSIVILSSRGILWDPGVQDGVCGIQDGVCGVGRWGAAVPGDRRRGQPPAEPWGGTLGLRPCSAVPLQHKFFTCEERSRSMEHVKEAYSRMKRNGIYKAMGEFDIFINYIERYLTMRRRN
ncbi:IL10 protein, partial [Pheucticus melanocephalus]|nr:IL10 protein [Pheucticus melanocephalus]